MPYSAANVGRARFSVQHLKELNCVGRWISCILCKTQAYPASNNLEIIFGYFLVFLVGFFIGLGFGLGFRLGFRLGFWTSLGFRLGLGLDLGLGQGLGLGLGLMNRWGPP